MSCNIIYGNPGSGKSDRLYAQLTKRAQEHPYDRIFLVVPEQFTLETQKKMVRRSGGHVITNIDVVSFERLAFRAFEEIGRRPAVLEDYGKSLLLRKIAADHEADLTFLRTNIRRIGYIDEVKSMLSELMQYAVGPDDLEAARDRLSKKDTLYHKLTDILIMYRGMEERFAESLLVAERLLDALADRVEEIPMLKNALYAFDGFTGFTPVQEKLIAALMGVSADFYFTVTLDVGEACFPLTGQEAVSPRVEELFYMSKQMIRKVCGLAREKGIPLSDPLAAAPGEGSRFAGKPALRHLEGNLFRPGALPYAGFQEEIHISSCANPREELEYALYQIAKMVRESDCRYSDFAIVSVHADTYEKYALSLMRQYHIPYFSDRKRDILYHPLTEAMRGLLEIISSDFSTDSVFRLLKTGLTGFSEDEIHRFESYCMARGIRGYRKFKTPFRVPTKQARALAGRLGEAGQNRLAEEMLALNDLRRRFMDAVEPVYLLFAGDKPSVLEISKAVYRFLRHIGAEDQIRAMQDELLAAGREEDAAVYDQIWPAVMDLLDKFVSLLGQETMDAGEYAEILDAGFSGIRIGILPPATDCVILGDLERTRLDGVRYLFFLGVNDGIVPQAADRGGMLSQYDREQLLLGGLRLAPTAREDVFLQQFYLYWNLTRPSDGLFLTYARLNAAGDAIRPSYLVSLLSAMYPQMEIDLFVGEENRMPLTREAGKAGWLAGLDQAAEGRLTPLWKALYAGLLADDAGRQDLKHFMEVRFAGARKETLGADMATRLYGSVLYNSVSRLENFIRCPYQHFLSYGLRLLPRESFAVEAADLGSLMHDALSRFSHKVDAGSGWLGVTQAEWESYLTESILETELGQQESVLYDSATNQHRLDRVRSILHASVEAMIRQIRAGSFMPHDYELDFHLRMDRLTLNGRIDRCDLYSRDEKNWVRIIDYKSGSNRFDLSDFYYGKAVQLVVYIEAVMQAYEKKGMQVSPGGIFYYHLDDPVCDLSALKGAESPEDALFAEYRLRGLVNASDEVINHMDGQMGKSSLIIPVGRNKDGSLSARSQVADEEGFEMLRRFSLKHCRETADRILAGEIHPHPFANQEGASCKYCDFRGVCGFDHRIPGYDKRQCPDLSDAEVWQKIREEL